MTEKAMEIMKHCNFALLTYGPNAGKINICRVQHWKFPSQNFSAEIWNKVLTFQST